MTDQNGKIFCEDCVANPRFCNKESKFIKGGCVNFHIQVQALQVQNKSQEHKKCAERQKAKAATPGTNPAKKLYNQ